MVKVIYQINKMQKEAFGQILNYARSIQNESQENFSINKNKEEYKNSLNFALNRVEKERIKFSKELSILKSLEHPNIMRLYKVFKDQKRYYIVLDLCSGGELFDEISK